MASAAQWLKYGANDKCDSIEALIKDLDSDSIGSVLELGAGSGALIAEIKRRGIGNRYYAADYSEVACRYLRENVEGVEVFQIDLTKDSPLGDYDLVVISHVLEHLEDPALCLDLICENLNFKYMIVECPLEKLLISKVKNLFRDQTINAAGHVYFFDKKSFEEILTSRLKIIKNRLYAPYSKRESLKFEFNKHQWSWIQRLMKSFTMRWGPKYFPLFWKMYWIANHAVLCAKKSEEKRE